MGELIQQAMIQARVLPTQAVGLVPWSLFR
jgi:hypothetical protein